MQIYYRLMTRQNYQTTVGKRSLTHPHSKRVSAAPDHNTVPELDYTVEVRSLEGACPAERTF
jgi:hypothetical protein